MRKRILIIILSILSTIAVAYAISEESYLNATSTVQYYGVGDEFKHTGKTRFTMGGIEWWILQGDENGDGYIVAESLVSVDNCPGASILFEGRYVNTPGISICMDTAQKKFDENSDNNDIVGKMIKQLNPTGLTTLSLPSALDYAKIISNNEENSSIFTTPNYPTGGNYIWMKETTLNKSVFFGSIGSSSSSFNSFKYLRYQINNTGTYCKLNPMFPIKLPQNNFMTGIEFIKEKESSIYEDVQIQEGNTFATINTKGGEGPYEISLVNGVTAQGDLDEKGMSVNAGIPLSVDFDLRVTDTTQGKAELIVNKNGGLSAGEYYVKLNIKDTSTNNRLYNDLEGVDPNRTLEVVIKIVVEKATPTISFNDTTQKNMKIGDSTYTGDITYTNTDTITSSDITYSLTGGVPSTLTVIGTSGDLKKYDAIVIGTNGTGLPTTFTLSATIAETENYKSATTTVNKSIFVYKELSDLKWTPSKNNYSINDVAQGSVVGSLQAVDGVGPYTYAFAQSSDTGYSATDAANNGSFSVTGSVTGANVKTTSNLLAGTYKMQLKVTDAKGAVKLVSVTIKVTAQTQAALEFKDAPGGSIITTTGITIKFDDTNNSLLAEGGTTSNPIEYYLADQVDQPNQIDGSTYLDVAKSGGLLTPKKVGEVLVYAKRPSNAQYGDVVTGFMKVKIEPAPQSIAFNSTTNPSKVQVGNDLMEDAKGTIVSSNANGIGGITYSSSDTSIATIDANGKVTGIASGNVTITATLNDSSSPSYDPNYETKTCTKTANVYTGMTVTWTAATPNLQAEVSGSNKEAGSIQVSDNSGNVFYSIPENYGVAENADGNLFQITPTGIVQLKNTITAENLDAHGNQYKIQVEVKDSNGTQIIDVVITIDDATNDAFFTDQNGVKITSITKVFSEDGNAFQLYSQSLNSGNVTYSIPSGNANVISTLGTGATTIHGVGSETVQAIIGAGSGYDGVTITIPVTITPGEQSVAFKDTTTVNQAFTAGATFADPAELKETTANTVSTRTITYTSTTPSVCSIDAAGTITMLTTGACIVTAENMDANWKPTTATKTINLYSGMGVSFTQSNSPQAGEANAKATSPVGSLTVNGGQGTKTYVVSTSTDPKNKDASFFSVNSSGIISLKKDINASDIASYYDATKQAYIMHVRFVTTDKLTNTVTTNAEVEIKGAKLNAAFDTGGVGKITKVYSPNGTFTLNLSSNAGNGTPTYQLKSDPAMPSDVLQSVASNGLVTIDNANDRTANANPVFVEAIIPPSGGYEGETIEVEVEITKAPQPNFGFQNTNMQMQTSSSLTPIIKGQLSSGTITITSNNTSLVDVVGDDLKSFTTEGTTTVTVIDSGDRNYQAATGTANVTVSSQPSYIFVIKVPSATYGDTGVKATILLNGATGANQAQTWVSSDPSIADIDAQGNITIYKAGSVDITCTQTSTGEPSASHTVTMVVKPKPITITINDKDKYVGEQVPVFDMTIPNGVLVGNDTISLPTFSCVDSAKVPITSTTPAGSYPITGSYVTGANPNYDITVTPGTLTVKQDASQTTWYHLVGVTSGNTLDPTKWYNEDVKVVLDTAAETAGSYDEISLDKTLWDPISITVTTEDENSEDVYFRINASGILSTSQSTTIKIDKTKPVIKSITGTQTNKDSVSQLLNKLTFGKFFKPGTKVSIQSEEILPTPTTKVSGVQDVSYEVYEIDRTTGAIQTTPKTTGNLTPDASGKSEVKLDDVGLYRVCAIAKDNAGNVGTEICSDLYVKKIDIDVDKNGTLDFNDSDGDGCPDINIVWKNPDNTWIKLNQTKKDNKLPSLNIDSNGDSTGIPDGIADINIDTDNDKIADLNIVDIKTWNPKTCVTSQIDEYCTDNTLLPDRNIDLNKDNRPDINVDLDDDGIPDIEIDSDGDGEPDINIDTDDDGTPDEKLKDLKEWIIDRKVFEVNGKKFHTMTGLVQDNIDYLEDGGVIAKPGDGQTFLPNYAIKVTDSTNQLDASSKKMIQELLPDKELGKFLNIDLTENNVRIQPDGKVLISIPIEEKIKNPKVMIEQADGSYVEATGTLKDGIFTYETTFVGGVAIFGDDVKDENKEPITPDPTSPDVPSKDTLKTPSAPNTSVKGSYANGIGGAMTNDYTNIKSMVQSICSLSILAFICFRKIRQS